MFDWWKTKGSETVVTLELKDLQEMLAFKKQQLENLKQVAATGVTDVERSYDDKILALENKLASEEAHAQRKIDEELAELRNTTKEKIKTLNAQRTIEASKIREENAAKLIDTENLVRNLETGINKAIADKAAAEGKK